ncbi:thioredoxin family protein [Naegleria gruberi]|uniref:Thioredoxin family protein n=1 Tax=Naegleria gruberi TaxID=5762 RepID=D2V8V4_NAEGR|nr:thioredoxin family protein [Naegleria gruberi]EFC46865.1 thioredoxin family protein [Naegleria gruberi]|eukprot:XP_002679609.1 thioredoxin family protein [Naegleria gruberi strain NEG-M]
MSQTFRVELYVYDLSMGLAATFSQQFTGKHFPGIWHTSIVVYGSEYFFGGGVQVMQPLTTPYGQPVRRIHLGDTQIQKPLFEEYVQAIGSERFRMDQYNLFENNCNNFSNECSNFLLGKNIPDDILGLPREFFETPLGQMVRPMIDNMMGGSSSPQQQQGGLPGGLGNMGNMGNMMDPQFLSQMMNNPMVSQMMNQFMGGMNTGNYNPYGGSNSTPQATPPPIDTYNDPAEIYKYNKSNVPQVVAKLKTTQASLLDELKGDIRVLNQLEQYLQLPQQDDTKSTLVNNETFELLKKLIGGAKENEVFPILDLVRLLVLTSKFSKAITIGEHKALMDIIEERFVSKWSSCSMPTQLMVLRLYCNIFDKYYSAQSLTPDTVKYITKDSTRLAKVVDIISTSLGSELEGVRLTAASLSCNLTLYLSHQNSDEEIQLLSSMLEYITAEKSKDVAHKMLLSMYRIAKSSTSGSSEIKEIAQALISDAKTFTSGPGMQALQSSDPKLITEVKKLLGL